jgi:ABC-2 type transport system permease protein
MRHLIQVFSYELRRNFRRKGYLFTTFGLPIIAVLVLIVVRGAAGDTSAAAGQLATDALTEAQNASRGFASAGYVDATGLFDTPPALSDRLREYNSEDEARAALLAGEIEAYYVIPPDYLEEGDVRQVTPTLSLTSTDNTLLRALLVSSLANQLEPEIAARVLRPATFDVTVTQVNIAPVGGDVESFEAASTLVTNLFSVALILVLFGTNGYLMQSVIEEKETRLIEILVATVRPWQLLGGKILALGLLGIVQMVVYLAAFFLASNVLAGEGAVQTFGALASLAGLSAILPIVPLLLVYFVLSYLLFAALFAIVGALSGSMKEGPQYVTVFTLPALLPLWFAQQIAAAPNDTLAVVLSIIPITAPLTMVQRLVLTSVPPLQVIASLVLLLATGLLLIWAAGRMFRVSTLMAGQSFKLRDIPMLLRG